MLNLNIVILIGVVALMLVLFVPAVLLVNILVQERIDKKYRVNRCDYDDDYVY